MASRSDNFNRTGSVALHGSTPSGGGSTWVDTSSSGGAWATGTDVGSGEVVAFVSSTSATLVAYLECSVTDHEVAAEIILIDLVFATQHGVCARYVDNSNYYYFFADQTGATFLYKNVAGSFTQLGSNGSQTFTAGVGKFLSLRCVGTTITGYVDGVQSATATDSDLTTGTKAGLRANNTFNFTPYVNSLSITDLAAAAFDAATFPFVFQATPVRGRSLAVAY